MGKRVAYQKIHIRRSYTTRELARLLNVHPCTVRGWVKQGMSPIDPGAHYYLFMGFDVKAFLEERAKAAKRPLDQDEFYCPRCKCAVRAEAGSVQIERTDRILSLSNWQLLIRGNCASCGCSLVRFSSTKSIRDTKWSTFFEQQAGRLYGTSVPCLDTSEARRVADNG